MTTASATTSRGRRTIGKLIAAALVASGIGPLVADGPTHAAGFEVDTLSDNAADGFTLREAISAANLAAGADEITFADGLTGTLELTGGHLDILESVSITGPGSGELTIDAGGSSRIFHSLAPGVDLALAGLTLTSGSSAFFGGAIVFYNGDNLTLDDMHISDSEAPQGGALDAANIVELVEITNSVITGNTATTGDGGSLRVDAPSARLVIEDSTIGDSEATVGDGGGVWSDTDSLGLVRSAFVDNHSGDDGGAIAGSAGSIQAVRLDVLRNHANGEWGGAGLESSSNLLVNRVNVEDNSSDSGPGGLALYSVNGQVSVVASLFARNTGRDASALQAAAPGDEVLIRISRFIDNVAFDNGGAILAGDTASVLLDKLTVEGSQSANGAAVQIGSTPLATLSNSAIVENTNGGDGGGVNAANASLEIRNSTISGNVAGGDGGGVYVTTGPLTVYSSTIVDNTAAGTGGALAWFGAANVAVDHSILSGNSAPTGPVADGALPIDWSFVDDITDLELDGNHNAVGVDPQLGALDDHGGGTETHRPAPFSPVIDAGDPAIANPSTFDQRGSDRVVDVIDVGAVEIQEEERLLWVPLEPARIADTRDGSTTIDGLHAGGGAVPNDGEIEVRAAGRAGVPADAQAIIVNMTAVGAVGNGFAVGHACLDERPTAASLNYTAGVNLGNEVIVGLDGDGDVCVFVKTASHIVLDVVGYVPADSEYISIEPARIMETRLGRSTIDGEFNGVGKPGEAGEIELQIGGRGGVPAINASAAVLYIAAVDAADDGFIVVYDCLGARPNASSLNHVAGVNRGNEIVAPIGPDGTICIFTRRDVDVTVDVVGYVPELSEFHVLDQPSRLFETRAGLATVDGEFEGVGTIAAGEIVELQVTGRAGIPATAATVTMNATAIGAQQNGNLIVWACGPRPLAASLNYVAGVNGGNELVAGLSAHGTVCVWSLRAVDLTLDVSGYTARGDALQDSSGKILI